MKLYELLEKLNNIAHLYPTHLESDVVVRGEQCDGNVINVTYNSTGRYVVNLETDSEKYTDKLK